MLQIKIGYVCLFSYNYHKFRKQVMAETQMLLCGHLWIHIYITSHDNVLPSSFLDISVLKGFIIFSSLKQNFGKYRLHIVSLKIRVNDQPESCLFTRG